MAQNIFYCPWEGTRGPWLCLMAKVLLFGLFDCFQASLIDSAGKESTCNAGDLGSVPGLGRSPGEGNGYPLQYSDLENPMDCIVYGVPKSRTRLSDFHSYLTVFLCFCIFSLLWLNLSLAKFSHRQKAGRGHEGMDRTVRSCSFPVGWWQPLEFINRRVWA